MLYMIICPIDELREHKRASLNEDYLQYVSTRTSEIVFGGAVEESDGALRRVVYFVDVRNEAAAWAFIRRDPYVELYRTIEVVAFYQKVARPEWMLATRPERVDPYDRPNAC